jgi:hypothetical protein
MSDTDSSYRRLRLEPKPVTARPLEAEATCETCGAYWYGTGTQATRIMHLARQHAYKTTHTVTAQQTKAHRYAKEGAA